MADGMGQLDALPHALAVGRYFAMRGFGHIDALERLPCALLRRGAIADMHEQVGVEEVIAGHRLEEVVELGAVAQLAKENYGLVRRYAEHPDLALGGADQTRHEAHKCGLPAAIRSD